MSPGATATVNPLDPLADSDFGIACNTSALQILNQIVGI